MINDQYGHNVGDLALVEFCNLIQSNCRESDLFARWGGEEFIILLPHIATSSAYDKAESLRVQLENTELHLSNAVFNICRHLQSPWSIFWVLKFLPLFLRDKLYDVTAKHRYHWFGKKESCTMLIPEYKNRFI